MRGDIVRQSTRYASDQCSDQYSLLLENGQLSSATRFQICGSLPDDPGNQPKFQILPLKRNLDQLKEDLVRSGHNRLLLKEVEPVAKRRATEEARVDKQGEEKGQTLVCPLHISI